MIVPIEGSTAELVGHLTMMQVNDYRPLVSVLATGGLHVRIMRRPGAPRHNRPHTSNNVRGSAPARAHNMPSARNSAANRDSSVVMGAHAVDPYEDWITATPSAEEVN